ncbi:hypothetical protein C8F04DRAFT_1086538 [Mycena alexandri]|uniref:Uncharacterized protein n=1 Tax=Mycena alexandri TaxID=1745969 RepID=A0AAD6T6K7_9AGAR|nr:hypothetical protein C8F04DRAFT_1086538 [Mycena alexandri]
MPAYASTPHKIKEPNEALFDGKAAMRQRESTELVVFCSQLHVTCEAAWKVFFSASFNAVEINFCSGPWPPEYIFEFLVSHNIYWPCFCAMHSSDWIQLNNDQEFAEPLSSQIKTWGNIGTYAVCHYKNPRCQFFLDLNSIYNSCNRREAYLPMGPKESALSRLSASALKTPTHLRLPFLPGFLGEKGVQLGQKEKLGCLNDIKWFLLPYIGSKIYRSIAMQTL